MEQDRSFSLSLEDRVHHSRPAIDYLFESAADAYGPTLAAVLLTGANQDGARGLAQVKRRGGLTIVQDPDEAQVATMPQAALDIHQPDHILTYPRHWPFACRAGTNRMLSNIQAKLLIVDDLPENLLALEALIKREDRIVYKALVRR